MVLGFIVEFFYNLKSVDLAEKISAFSDKLEEYDVVLLYYAGHGFPLIQGC
ncbi:MAG: caspase family protein [Clostridiales bacterium]|nr:caspase family protein [Clostridiales bacterium]